MSEQKLNILIVEDDPLFAVELEMLIIELDYNVLARVDNSGEALEVIMTDSPDFILMDVDIKGKMTGLEIGEKIKHLDIPICFITSYGDEEHYKQAQKSNMVGYLVKPVNKYSLKSAIALAIQSLKPNPVTDVENELGEDQSEDEFILKDYLFFKKKGAYKKVFINEILFLEADGDYVNVHLKGKEKFTTRMRLSDMESQLPEETYMRVHRSYIINLEKIEAINFQINTLEIDGHRIPISRSNKDKLQQSVRKFK